MKNKLLWVTTGLTFLASSLALTAKESNGYQQFKSEPNAKSAFAYLHEVATNPRCANCHGVVEDGAHRPTVGEDRHQHPMNISSVNNLILQATDHGFKQAPGYHHPVNCRSCHQNQNGSEPGMPPGAANDLMPGFVWHMPPPSMAIARDLSAKDLCEHWLDPARNSFLAQRGGREDMETFRAEFLDHHATIDPLVRWSWAPGPGRKPAPGSHKEFVKAMEIWIDGGAPCPTE